MNDSVFIHPMSDVQTSKIGDDTKIWQFSVVLKEAVIGVNCNINANVFIENKVIIGNNCTIKSGVQIWDGITLGDNVFVGPNVTFTNDLIPRSKKYPEKYLETHLEYGCSVGANATILPNIIIGKFAMVGAGSTVTKSVPANALVVGCPAKVVGWVNTDGTRMEQLENEVFRDSKNQKWRVSCNQLSKI